MFVIYKTVYDGRRIYLAAAQYNGNIAAVKFYNAGVSSAPRLGYRFSYDGANRLTKAETYMGAGWSSTANYRLPEITYDENGNIKTLHRNNETGSPLDRFTYVYQSNRNRLASITNAASGSQTYNYGYDNNGNVTSDQYRGINNIIYNIRNLPEQLNASGTTVNYWYDNNGSRFRKQDGSLDEIYVLGINGETEAVFDINGTAKFFNILAGSETIGRFIPGAPTDLYLSNTTLSGTYEAQNSITVENNVTVAGPTVLKAGNNIHLKPGFTAPSGIDFTAKIGTVHNVAKRYYYLKDHLGSIRVAVNEAGEIVSSDDYDPWGMILNGRSGNDGFANDKYKFTGKELDTETGYYHCGWRPYDGRIGRWLQTDPKFDKYPNVSPYAYVFNNPLRYTDPFGDTVNVDPQLLKPVVNEEGKAKSREEMTAGEIHRTDFQSWWKENKETVEGLFGEGGKYEATTINFNLGTMPYPAPSLSNLFNLFATPERLYNAYDALTSFGVHGQDVGSFVRGSKAVGSLNMSVSNLVFNIWFNPQKHLVQQNAAYHEWKHVSIIFDRVKNNLIIPSGPEQHWLINRGQVPTIK